MAETQRFRGRTVLVTGASSGIGRACAKALGAEGANVVLAGRRRDRLEDVAKAIGDPARTRVVTGDTREEAACAAFVQAATDGFGGLDGLVNAAGVLGNGGVADTPTAEWRRVMDTNLDALFFMTRAAAEALKARRGAIVNVSSVAGGVRPYANLASYCVSKAAVDMLTRCSALDFAPFGVRVNAISPGVVVTELHTVTQAVADYPAFLERGKVTHPIGRVGTADEVAALVLYLLGPDAGWITGANVSIDGGRALASAR